MTDRFLSQNEVCHTVGLSRMTIHRMRKAGDFPPPLYLTQNRSRMAWRESDIQEWMQSRVVAKR